MTAWFVTSSGTGIGKTLVVSALARALRQRAVPIHAIKPVITGFTPETAEMSDTARIGARQQIIILYARELSRKFYDHKRKI